MDKPSDYTLEDALYDATVSADDGLVLTYNHNQCLWEVGLNNHGASNPDLQGALMDVLAQAGGTA